MDASDSEARDNPWNSSRDGYKTLARGMVFRRGTLGYVFLCTALLSLCERLKILLYADYKPLTYAVRVTTKLTTERFFWLNMNRGVR